jgi:hypothetical protein
MFIPVGPPRPQHSGVYGPLPTWWADTTAIDGDDRDFANNPAGSVHYQMDRTNRMGYYWEKRKEDGRDDDWGPLGGVHVICETVLYSDFTDGGSTAGTYALKQTLPIGAYVLKVLLDNVSAALTVGDGTTVDRYNTGTPSVFTTDTSVDVGAVSGTAWHDAAKTVTLTVTSGTDWGLVTAGQLTIKLFYLF